MVGSLELLKHTLTISPRLSNFWNRNCNTIVIPNGPGSQTCDAISRGKELQSESTDRTEQQDCNLRKCQHQRHQNTCSKNLGRRSKAINQPATSRQDNTPYNVVSCNTCNTQDNFWQDSQVQGQKLYIRNTDLLLCLVH